MLDSGIPQRTDCPSVVDPQSVLATLKNPDTLSKIDYILSQNGISTASPWLRLDVEANGEQLGLELEVEDIRKLFASFGTVENVVIQQCQKATAFILMRDVVSAYLAQQTLHLHYVPPYDARLYVRWSFPETLPPHILDPPPYLPSASLPSSLSASAPASAPAPAPAPSSCSCSATATTTTTTTTASSSSGSASAQPAAGSVQGPGGSGTGMTPST